MMFQFNSTDPSLVPGHTYSTGNAPSQTHHPQTSQANGQICQTSQAKGQICQTSPASGLMTKPTNSQTNPTSLANGRVYQGRNLGQHNPNFVPDKDYVAWSASRSPNWPETDGILCDECVGELRDELLIGAKGEGVIGQEDYDRISEGTCMFTT
jgi:hypothetical protein